MNLELTRLAENSDLIKDGETMQKIIKKLQLISEFYPPQTDSSNLDTIKKIIIESSEEYLKESIDDEIKLSNLKSLNQITSLYNFFIPTLENSLQEETNKYILELHSLNQELIRLSEKKKFSKKEEERILEILGRLQKARDISRNNPSLPSEEIKKISEKATNALVEKLEAALEQIDNIFLNQEEFDFNQVEQPLAQIFSLKKER